ncbi:MAG: TRAP transporter large permease subunit [Rhodobacteraceae bacterium]|nr:TRAP transporter large permease subunit [Paracoccaceae bacterium]MCF8512787.1 TRAP transporter large permease subunit [Paracoccaceae bacterium]MCF8517032.1 TRAP transporter large permease subunit [Paracoccaceae bacterium]
MFDISTAAIIVVLLLTLVMMGVHVAVSLGVTSLVGLFLTTGKLRIVEATLASTSAEALRDFTFAVIPLFMLMGEFMGRSGAVTDIYIAINRSLKSVPARLGIATVLGNTVFSFVTGVSIASAAAFARIGYPEMKAHGYNKGFALGSIAGSSVLGMLIPPSVLMIVWGILTEQSIGRLFLAGVLPGMLLALMFIVYVLFAAWFRPDLVGQGKVVDTSVLAEAEFDSSKVDVKPGQFAISIVGVLGIICSVLGGIWLGIFTPTEGAGAGAALALVLAFVKGMTPRGFIDAIYSVGKTAAPILILLLCAALYSRTLAMSGVTTEIREFFVGSGFNAWTVFFLIVLIWFILGMIIDSISIMLLTVPIVEPVAMAFGFDQLTFAIVGIIAIEAGLLTPPFGLLVYTVKAAIRDDSVGVQHIFWSSIPYWLIMLLLAAMLMAFPVVTNFLPNLMM